MSLLTHWGRVTHICVSKLTIIGSDNGLSPGRHQAIIWTNAGILLFGPLGANFSEILIEISTFSFKKMRFKVSSEKWRPFCIGLNGLKAPDPKTLSKELSCCATRGCLKCVTATWLFKQLRRPHDAGNGLEDPKYLAAVRSPLTPLENTMD